MIVDLIKKRIFLLLKSYICIVFILWFIACLKRIGHMEALSETRVAL